MKVNRHIIGFNYLLILCIIGQFLQRGRIWRKQTPAQGFKSKDEQYIRLVNVLYLFKYLKNYFEYFKIVYRYNIPNRFEQSTDHAIRVQIIQKRGNISQIFCISPRFQQVEVIVIPFTRAIENKIKTENKWKINRKTYYSLMLITYPPNSFN